MKLSLDVPAFYRMKRGQTLEDVAAAFCIPQRRLAAFNRLTEAPAEGQVLLLPQERGDLYTVRGGETKSLLCGSPSRFEACNGTHAFYPGQTILLG